MIRAKNLKTKRLEYNIECILEMEITYFFLNIFPQKRSVKYRLKSRTMSSVDHHKTRNINRFKRLLSTFCSFAPLSESNYEKTVSEGGSSENAKFKSKSGSKQTNGTYQSKKVSFK